MALDNKKYKREWYNKNKQAILEKLRKRQTDPVYVEQKRAYARNYVQKLRDKVFDLLGWECACCGEYHREFLTIDHIFGGGNKHRKEVKWSTTFYRLVLSDPNAKLKYRTLCMNCNHSYGHYGRCPHGN